ncbi:hypothetical protein D3C80_178920 [compost metagenome]
MEGKFELFKERLFEVLERTLPDRDLNNHEVVVDPDTREPFVFFTFFLSEEVEVDKFIRAVRESLLKWPELSVQTDTNQFVYTVWKSHIQSHDYWSVHFWLSEKYSFTEDSQP